MIAGLCKILKGIFVTAWLCAAPEVAATVYYVDPGCPSNGTGLSTTCGTSGPVRDIGTGIGKLAVSGDILEIRGPHPAHGTCVGSTNGVYETDRFLVRNKTNATIRAFTGFGDNGGPVIEGASTPSLGWTRCTDCSASSSQTACQNVPGLCSDYYYILGTGNYSKAYAATYANSGRITYRVAAKASMTNAHTFTATSCSPSTWIACNQASDCPVGQSCNFTVPEVDTYSQETSGGYIVGRWCLNGANCTTPGKVINTNNGNGFDISSTTNLTIGPGINFRNFKQAAITMGPDSSGVPPTNPTITGNTFANSCDTGGSAYQIVNYNATAMSITNNYFAYSQDESIHSQAATVGTALTITGNFIRDVGDQSVLGSRVAGSTSEAMTIGHQGSGSFWGVAINTGIYTGSLIANNYILRTGKQGMIFENSFQGIAGNPVIVRDNIFNTTVRSGFKFACDSSEGSAGQFNIRYIDFYNNLVINANSGGADAMFNMVQANNCATVDHINIYNNTGYNNKVALLTSGSLTDITVRNNIFMEPTANTAQVVQSDVNLASMVLEYNFIYSGNASPVKWKNTSRLCADVALAGTGNVCNSIGPRFANTIINDFHLSTFANTSLAVDAGTTSLAARTLSINNTVASKYGLPVYADAYPQGGSAWDMGATELMLSDGGLESNSNLTFKQVPDPCDCVTVANGAPLEGIGPTNFSPPGPVNGTYYGSYVYANCVGPSIACEGSSFTVSNLTVGQTYRIEGNWATPYVGATLNLYASGIASSTLTCNYLVAPDVSIVHYNPILTRLGPGCFIAKDTPLTTNWDVFSAIFTADATFHTFYIYADDLAAPTYVGVQFDNIVVKPYVVAP